MNAELSMQWGLMCLNSAPHTNQRDLRHKHRSECIHQSSQTIVTFQLVRATFRLIESLRVDVQPCRNRHLAWNTVKSTESRSQLVLSHAEKQPTGSKVKPVHVVVVYLKKEANPNLIPLLSICTLTLPLQEVPNSCSTPRLRPLRLLRHLPLRCL